MWGKIIEKFIEENIVAMDNEKKYLLIALTNALCYHIISGWGVGGITPPIEYGYVLGCLMFDPLFSTFTLLSDFFPSFQGNSSKRENCNLWNLDFSDFTTEDNYREEKKILIKNQIPMKNKII